MVCEQFESEWFIEREKSNFAECKQTRPEKTSSYQTLYL